jgi:CheY-like chemotaxis protein
VARVLVIDDQAGTAETLAHVLKVAGFDALIALTGREGLALARRERPDLILSDLVMPDKSGIDVIRELRKEGNVVPFVLVSGYSTTKSTVEAMALGAVNCVDKPLFDDDLTRVVQEALSGARPATKPPEAHAAARWARAVVGGLDSRRDLPTFAEWGRSVGVSARSLAKSCTRAGLDPRDALRFVRLLRAVCNRQRYTWRFEDSLDVGDERTLSWLFRLGGSRTGTSQDMPDNVDAFLEQQVLVCDPVALLELRRLLGMRPS